MNVLSDKEDVNVSRVLSLLSELKRATKELKVATATSTGKSIAFLLHGLPKKTFTIFQNNYNSVNDGLKDGTLTSRAAKKSLEEALEVFEIAVMKEISAANEPSRGDSYGSMDNNLKGFEGTMNDLQTGLIRSPFYVGRAPIVPITAPILSLQNLKKNGFKADPFQGYSILHNQIVAGLSSEFVRTEMSKDPKAKAVDIYQEFIDVVKSKHKSLDLIQLGREVPYWSATWSWLIPSRDFKVLASSTSSGRPASSINVKSWGFPFVPSVERDAK